MNGKLALAALALLALGAYALDLHQHRCETCGSSWRHLGAASRGDERAHTCKSCGSVQWWRPGERSRAFALAMHAQHGHGGPRR